MTYPIITLKKGKDRAVLLRHPWLFSGAIEKADKAQEGDVVQIRSIEGKILAHGHYAPQSQIRVKMFDFSSENLLLNEDYWWAKLQAAWTLRKEMIQRQYTTGFRLIHAEGDELPGIVVDVYADVASVQLRTAGMERLSEVLCDFLTKEVGCQHIFLKKEDKEEGKWLKGAKPQTEFLENGLRFVVDVVQGQKTGFFLDQRNNRAMVGNYAKGKTVLNAFSYTGGFSTYALAGGAKEVVSLDISKSAVEMSDINVKLNFPETQVHKPVAEDCFRYLKEMPKDVFDCIILDPPAFSKNLATVKNATRGYKEINLKALQKIKTDGLLFTFSCSQHISTDLFQKIIFGAAADAHREVKILAHLSQGADHPISIYHPEGDYLKGLMLWVGK